MAVLKYKKDGVWHTVPCGYVSNQLTEEAIQQIYDALSVPVLAPKQSWYKGTTAKADITAIQVVSYYKVTGSEAESWSADEAETGSIMCYVNDTVLTISAERAGGLALNPNSESAFSGFLNATSMTGQHFLRMERVARAYSLFSDSAFEQLGDDTWNFARVNTLAWAFAFMPNLTTVNLGKSALSTVLSLQGAFYSDTALKSVVAPKLRIENATAVLTMFEGCTALESIDFGESTFAKVTNAIQMFSNCTKLASIVWPNATFAAATSLGKMFYNCTSLKTIDLSSMSFSKVTSCSHMFSSIAHSTVSTGMQLTEIIGVENLSFPSCTDFTSMFYGCQHLTKLNLSKWDVSKGTSFSHMFADMSSLKTLILDDGEGNAWNPVSAVTFNCMFNDNKAEELDISCFSVAKPMSTCQMFERFTGNIIGYELLNTSETTEMTEMFSGINMEVLDLTSYDTRKVSGTLQSGDSASEPGFKRMFYDAKYLREIRMGELFDTRGDGTVTEEQAFKLPVPSPDYIDGADGYWYEADGTLHRPDAPPNPAVLGREVTLYAVDPTVGLAPTNVLQGISFERGGIDASTGENNDSITSDIRSGMVDISSLQAVTSTAKEYHFVVYSGTNEPVSGGVLARYDTEGGFVSALDMNTSYNEQYGYPDGALAAYFSYNMYTTIEQCRFAVNPGNSGKLRVAIYEIVDGAAQVVDECDVKVPV